MKLQIGVKVLIRNDEGKLLFIKRTKLLQNETEFSWDIPGGRIEANEDLMTALNREVSEELHISLDNTPRLVNAQDIFVHEKNLHVVRLTYLLDETIQPDAISLSNEHQQLTWVSLDKARSQITEPFLKATLMLLP